MSARSAHANVSTPAPEMAMPPAIVWSGLPRARHSMSAEEDRLALVRRLRERALAASAHLREEIVPLAEALEETGTHYPALVARLGADTYAYVEQWLAQLEAELRG